MTSNKSKMRRNVLILFTLFFVILEISPVIADGGYFPPPGYWVRPGAQNAIIFYENNVETMILTSGFQGNAKDLVWIIPTPTKAEITKANEQIFTNIAVLTRPERDYSIGNKMMFASTVGEAQTPSVAVIDWKQVDYYDVKTIVSTNSQDFAEWLNKYGYQYPEEYSYVLEYYIQKGWFFTAIKVSPEAQGATEVTQDFQEGHPTPIKMVFLSNKIVFPLKISSIDFKPEEEINYQPPYKYPYSNYVPIQLYIIADGKYEADGFTTIYGNWFTKSKIENLGTDENGNSFVTPKNDKYFITSLNARYQKSQMDDDVFFKKSDDDKKINAGKEPWEKFLEGLFIIAIILFVWLITLGILFWGGVLILILSSNNFARIFAWVMQSISIILTSLLIGFYLFISFFGLRFGGGIIYVLIAGAIIVGIGILVMVLEAKYKNKRR